MLPSKARWTSCFFLSFFLQPLQMNRITFMLFSILFFSSELVSARFQILLFSANRIYISKIWKSNHKMLNLMYRFNQFMLISYNKIVWPRMELNICIFLSDFQISWTIICIKIIMNRFTSSSHRYWHRNNLLKAKYKKYSFYCCQTTTKELSISL